MKDIDRKIHPHRAILAGGILALLVLGGLGCAYFNTFYNAKKLYAEAEELPKAKDGTVNSAATAKYDDAITKCEALITAYPKSKHVDDAILLIGKCLYEQGEYDDAIGRLEALETVSRDTKVRAEGRLYAAKSYIAKGEIEAAVPIVQKLVDENPKNASDETLFLLGTAFVKIGKEDEAVRYLEQLANKYPKSPYRVNADLESAEVYAERGEYGKSLAVYDRLKTQRLNEKDTIRYLSSLGRLHVDAGEYPKAVVTFRELDHYVLDPPEKAANTLVAARAYVGMDSLSVAIESYKTVAASYPKSAFSAEARFRLGEIYQDKLDSLQVAKQQFDEVPGQFANSPYAEDAIARSAAISRVLRLRDAVESGAQTDQAAVEFDLAEIQLFQFKNYEKALEGYKKILDEYPDNDLTPKAAYATAYIYELGLVDMEKARVAYEYVVNRYPDSQQAEYARQAIARIQAQQKP